MKKNIYVTAFIKNMLIIYISTKLIKLNEHEKETVKKIYFII